MSYVDTLIQSLPSTQDGLLPSWLLFVSAVSVFNSVQTYISGLELTRKVYDNKPQEVTNLSARTFGTWTVLASIIRFYGAVYNLTFSSFLLAGAHFASEWLVYKTVKFGKGLAGPLITASLTITWMTLQRDFYVKV
ncbi:similar to Saccharomyces cerevisiae YER044C ERG28 Endoplasmic reticulum membrane protein, may facilitate protein-protein interactions between the Erg26p dehydrogenase and the Erg27p 3-ketoreductase [Geotrichum candidum]|uniref:Similar to Saccharomyces cerevisiae YER044C ERG28 Endoplasmic reticulum membrane protein, may facilitate protein-protein interactions between the Erg26p dehydrogenase and the Erg27p 3-ketoreductase n=1 Tax=Geotrichum candidum TaxID=1173061 RepID=A0A0J9X5L7_GEOCN|nr:similar to Saccharomyces cerevisiae YER044C ERG28 Endoplasmic reticulum membrane protein, may facilitate protein-protein interactions between the Erg26p dehydrogenase and the Erg27p 3-ketoreductase [Geotrichum candidum]